MAWVTIKGKLYYRRSTRVGGRVVTEHVGGGPLAELLAAQDSLDRQRGCLRRAEAREAAGRIAHSFDDFFMLDDFLADVVATLAHRQGWHRHKRQWRRKRGAAVATLAQLRDRLDALKGEAARRALLKPDLSGVPEADRAVLARAAAGDAEALAAAEPYFRDAALVRRWGDPVHAARCWLVHQASGGNRLNAEAAHRHADAMRDGLGWEGADALERIAITRVVNNWLAVGYLEAQASQCPADSKSRGATERALSQAERRLAQATRLLATLRGTTPGAVFVQAPAPALA